jgi:O-antigen/teichoic acid export membrane protein
MSADSPTKKPPIRQLLMRGFAWAFGQSVGGLLVQLITLVVLSRLLTPSEFGIVAIVVSLLGGLALVVELGVGPALIQRPTITSRHIGSAIWLSLSLAIVFMVVLQLVAQPVAIWLGIGDQVTALRALASIVLLHPLVTIMTALTRRDLRMREAATADLMGTALGYSLVSIALALLGFGLWALVAAQIAQLGLTLLILACYQRRNLSLRFGIQEIKDVLSFGAYFSVGRVANYMAQRFDRALIGVLLGSEAAGYYQRALNMLQLVGPFLSGPLENVMFPLLSRIQDDTARLRRSYRASTAAAAMVTMPVSVLLCISAPVLVPLVLGSQWHGVVLPAQIMSGVLFFRTNDSITATLMRAIGRVKVRAALQVLYAVLSLGSIWILQDFRLEGIAAGLLCATIINFTLMSFLVRRVTSMTMADNFTPLIPGALIALCLAVLGAGSYLLLGRELFTLPWMALHLAVSGLAYLGLAAFLPASLLPGELASLRSAVLEKAARRARIAKLAKADLDAAQSVGQST